MFRQGILKIRSGVIPTPCSDFLPKRVRNQPGMGVRFAPESGFGIIPEWGVGMVRNTHSKGVV